VGWGGVASGGKQIPPAKGACGMTMFFVLR
jgi:hypothetical protein